MKLIISGKGYIGLWQPAAQRGDLLCVLLGVRLPIILRGIETHFILIGESYIDGVMDARLIEELEEGKFTVEEYTVQTRYKPKARFGIRIPLI